MQKGLAKRSLAMQSALKSFPETSSSPIPESKSIPTLILRLGCGLRKPARSPCCRDAQPTGSPILQGTSGDGERCARELRMARPDCGRFCHQTPSQHGIAAIEKKPARYTCPSVNSSNAAQNAP
jgi:hypothetical protein